MFLLLYFLVFPLKDPKCTFLLRNCESWIHFFIIREGLFKKKVDWGCTLRGRGSAKWGGGPQFYCDFWYIKLMWYCHCSLYSYTYINVKIAMVGYNMLEMYLKKTLKKINIQKVCRKNYIRWSTFQGRRGFHEMCTPGTLLFTYFLKA